MKTYQGWTKIQVSGQTGSQKDGTAKYFTFDTALPTAAQIEAVAGVLPGGLLDARRLYQTAYGGTKIENRPDPNRSGNIKKRDPMETMGLIQSLIADNKALGMGFEEAYDAAMKSAAEAPQTVVVNWITADENKALDLIEKATLADLFGTGPKKGVADGLAVAK